ncbi:MAG: disulfide thiol oxidoreductase, Erv1 / Alr family [Homavirus sp.]|uniref:Sulfhydryl oxidase n=1 Tax=Homavirus sp. TaxID=2487769 RepID=A0A3G5A564_9VIRU|nr:MAG: disulfide thiol oxidoreductase, Erv1 / Alr family [Homavirus sp.]
MSNYTDPKEWGPHFWYVMRCTANNYQISPTARNKMDIKRFFEDIGNILPCEQCVGHYKETWIKYPIDIGTCCRDCLKKWVENVYSDISDKTKNQSTRKGNVETKYSTHNTYNNSAHNNIAHNNIAHNNIAHNNIAHNNIAHNNIAHNDIAHNNITYDNNTSISNNIPAIVNINNVHRYINNRNLPRYNTNTNTNTNNNGSTIQYTNIQPDNSIKQLAGFRSDGPDCNCRKNR